MVRNLCDARGEVIESEFTPDGITEMLLERIDADEFIDAGAATQRTSGGGESDGLAAKILKWVPVDLPNGWASLAVEADHNPRNINETDLWSIVNGARDLAVETGSHPGILIGRAIREFAERFARHSCEKAIENHYDDVSLAGLELETSNIDLVSGETTFQVYTGSSSKKWHDKTSKAPSKASNVEKHHREACEFEYFIFARIIDGVGFKIGAREVKNPEATTAYAKSGK